MNQPAADSQQSGRQSPSRLILTLVVVAVVLTLGAVVTGFVIAARVSTQAAAPQTGPVAVPAAPAPGADGRYCDALMPHLPQRLDGQPRRALIDSGPGVAVWGDPQVVLRCGLPDPAELTCSAELTKFTSPDGTAVEWLQIAEGDAVTYWVVDRPVRIAITLPAGADIAMVQQLTEVIGSALPERPVCTAGGVTPTDNS